MRRDRRKAGGHGDEEVPWPSFADALTGLLFVFIVLALSFAYQLSKAKIEAEEERQEWERKAERDKRARRLAEELLATESEDPEVLRRSVALCLDRVPGVLVNAMADDLRLSIYLEPEATKRDAVFFKPGDAVLFGTSCHVAQAIGDCLVGAVSSGRLEQDGDDFQLRVFVEGHTDAVPLGLSLRDKFETNWELSGARAAAVVRAFLVSDESARGCTAHPAAAASIQEYVSDRRIVVNAVGLADRRPAWQRICAEDSADPVCACLQKHRGDAEACREPLQKDAQLQGIRTHLRGGCSRKATNGVCGLLVLPDDALVDAAQEAGLEVPEPDSFTEASGDLLVRWANRPGNTPDSVSDEAEDARRKHQRRVDLRFEIAPRALPDEEGGGVD